VVLSANRCGEVLCRRIQESFRRQHGLPVLFEWLDGSRLGVRELPRKCIEHQKAPQPYNRRMTVESPVEVQRRYVSLMGQRAGEMFAELMQDAARLHQKWNEFVRLFAINEAQIETLNRAAPGFFYLVQDAWWDGLILHIFRMTDPNPRTLSLPNLKPLLKVSIRDGFDQKLTAVRAASKFAHDLRHVDIGHRNREVALRVKAVPSSTRAEVVKAIAAIDDALHFVDHHHTGRAPTYYEHLDILGGSEAILWIVQRALKARDEDIGQGRPLLRFPDL
jgi:AbiU2